MDSKALRSKNINNKNKKASSKQKTNKKKKCDGPTCSMFLSELTKKLHMKKKNEEERPKNIVHTIIDSISHALPVKFSRTSPPKQDSPLQIDAIQDLAPELLPTDAMEVDLNTPPEVPPPEKNINVIQEHTYKPLAKKTPIDTELKRVGLKPGIVKASRIPLKTIDLNLKNLKPLEQPKPVVRKEDASVNTAVDRDVASELARHVTTLRKISLIAEEFNQKTARNLKEIVDSVQEDLLRKLNEAQAEENASF
ncbi:unnamed protein product [Plutella xylostella]|uniref:(diamondback moth) hypothetical protein n=1 Tax=Plutella xylostella TaxID=51655 RepID=A0A8S4EJY3_PLUXY|nr:unnamed protein product [Plutella xylostella]